MVDRTIAVKLRAEVADFKRNMADAAKAVDNNVSSIDTLSSHVGLLGTALTGFAALAVTRFAQFDKQMSSVQAATRTTGAELDSLRQAAIRAGADTAFSATEAAAGIENLAKAGVETADILNGGLSGALNLAAAGNLEVGEAAEIAAVAMQQFNLRGSDVTHISDLLAAGAGKAVGDVSDLSQALNQAGLVASGTGLSIEETTGSLSAFASAGLIGSDAGTSFKTMLQVLSAPSAAAEKEMRRLGIAAYDANGAFVGMEALAGQLETAFKGKTDAERNSALATIFGTDAVRAANELYNQGAKGIADWTAAVDDQGYAAEQARIANDNLLGDLERLGGSFDTVLIQSGSGANDSLRTLVQTAESLVDAIGEIPAPVLTATTLIAGAGGLALLGAAGMGKLVVGTRDAIGAYRDLAPAGSRAERSIRGVGRGAIASVGALSAFLLVSQAIESTAPDVSLGVEEMRARLRALAEDGSGAVRLFEDLNSTWVNFEGFASDSRVVEDAEAFQELLRQTADPGLIGAAQNSLAQLLPLFSSSDLGQFQARLAEINTELATMASGGDLVGASDAFSGLADAYKLTDEQAGQLLLGLPEFRDALIGQAEAAGIATDDATLLKLALGEVKPAAEGAADAVGGVAPEMDAGAQAAERAAEAAESYAKALAATADPVATYESILAQKEAAERETAEATAAATEDSSDSWEDYAEDVKVTTADLIKDWQRQAREAREFEENLAVIAAAGGQAMADELRAKGPEVAGSVAAVIAEAGPKQQASAIAAHAAATGGSISQQMADTLVAQGWRLQRAVDGTIEAAHPKKDIVVTVTDNGSADHVKGEIASIPTSKTVTITTIRQVLGSDGGGSQYVLRRAAGGPIPMVPGAVAGQDSVPILGMPGEHMLTTSDVAAMGGQAGVYAFRAALHGGVQHMAKGGEVGAAQRGLDQAWDGLRSARAAARRAREAVRAAEAAERRAERTESEADDRAAERQGRAAQRALDRAERRVQEAESRVDDATGRRNRLRDERGDVRTALRRGEIRDSVSGGLSGALGVTDQLRDLANSGDVSDWRADRMRGVASNAEKALTSLYKQAERIDAKAAAAVERFEMLKQVQDQVRSGLVSGFGLDQVQGAINPWTGQEGPVTGQALVTAAEAYRGKVVKFSGLLKKLQEAGVGGAILQEVAGYGIEQGIPIAEALLSLPKGELRGLAQTYEDISRFAGYAGASVARAVGGEQGGLWEAEQAVKAAEAQADAIDKRINNWAKILGNELAHALGIKARANGGPVTAGHPYLVNEHTPNSELFIPSQSGYVLNNRQMAGLGTGGPSVTHNWNIVQHFPVNEPPSVSAAKIARQLANTGRR